MNSTQLALRDASEGERAAEVERDLQPATNRRTVDSTGPYIHLLQSRFAAQQNHGYRAVEPTAAGALQILPPKAYASQPATSFTTKFTHLSFSRIRSSVNCVAWTPDGQRCVTGTQSGEFAIWNGSNFRVEACLQAHESPVRAMRYSHNEIWFVTAEDNGTVKYWKGLNQHVKAFSAHKEAVHGLAFAPTDLKFATGSADSLIKIWDFRTCVADTSFSGHGGDIRTCDWHPQNSIVASGSKDTLIKLWDARQGGSATATLQGHRAGITQVKWHSNGNWLLSSARDQACKVFDGRMLREVATFNGHKCDVTSIAWHPVHEDLFVSGGFDGTLLFWLMGHSGPQAEVVEAHQGAIWSVAWHPVGHLLASGAADHCTRFWCRARPGDAWQHRQRGDQEAGQQSIGEATAKLGKSGLFGTDAAIPGIGEATATPAVASTSNVLALPWDGLPGKVEVKAEPRAEQNAMTLKMEEAALAETAGGVPGLAMDDKFSKKRPLPPPPPRAAPGRRPREGDRPPGREDRPSKSIKLGRVMRA